MKKKKIIYLSVAALAVLLIIIYAVSGSKKSVEQKVKAIKGDFEVVVATSGELVTPNTVNIEGPMELRSRNVRSFNDIKILDLVPEGTLVNAGDYVATLDPSSIQTRLKDLEAEIEKYQSQLDRKHLDTSLNLRGARNSIKNMEFDVEEKNIVVEQSIYEPPATQRQAKNNLDKALRDLEQEKRNYALKVEQAVADIAEVKSSLVRIQKEYQTTEDLMRSFTITAPSPGMVIYTKGFGGEKRKAGSTISMWDLTIATLPDFSVMDSRTYVNEVDISKVKAGQPVQISVDAFPERSYTGEVVSVANIGEQLRNTDAKVFEVVVRMNGHDDILRPAMTTSNRIITANFKDVVYIPIEALFGNDTTTYVYRTNGTKQIVVSGEVNENYCIIEQGLGEGDEIYLSTPINVDKFKQVGDELIPVIKQRIEQKKKEEEERLEAARKAEEARKNFQLQMMGQRGGGRFGGNGGSIPATNGAAKPADGVQMKERRSGDGGVVRRRDAGAQGGAPDGRATERQVRVKDSATTR